MKVDVAVVGASPAGLAAAAAAAAAGARTAVLEARAELGVPEPPACILLHDLWRGPALPATVVRRRLDGLRLHAPGGAAVEVLAPGVVLHRGAFDRWLAQQAAAAGADLLLGLGAVGAGPDRTLTGGGREVRARVVVFADGPASAARRFLAPLRDPAEVRWGAVLRLAPPVPQDGWVRIFPGRHAPGGRSQLNPMGAREWTHWTFWRGAPEEAERLARAALRRDAAALGWPEPRADYAGLGPDSVLALPGRLTAPGVVVCGGAAGQGGLEAGVAAGRMAGAAAAALAAGDARAPARYERAWRRRWVPGYRALRWLFARAERLGDAGLDAALAPWAGARLHLGDLGVGRGGWVAGALRAAAERPAAWPALWRAATA